MQLKKAIFAVIASLFLLSLGAAAQAVNPAKITFTNIDIPGAAVTIATGINNPGDITGILIDSAGAFHGYLADKSGAFVRAIDFPGAPQTEPSGINERGDIVGSYIDDSGVFHGFLLQDGNYSTIDFPGAADTFPFDINGQGVIAGFYQDAALLDHGFTLDKDGFHIIDDPAQASPSTEIMSINNRGDILGDFDFDEFGIFHGAFLLSHGTFSPFNVPDDANGIFALGLSNNGTVAGSAIGDNFLQRGFISDKGNVVKFDFPGSLATAPIQINTSNHIVGVYADRAVNTHSFLVTFDGPSATSNSSTLVANTTVQAASPATGQSVVCGSVAQAIRAGATPNAANLVCR